ncbi:MAG: type II secretion system F family protein, partial [Candidatus Liptonbacteria bacterium]|nr:type II secretion system F family protein [Candidatus Liptonbacteria bacterium]
LYKYSAADKNGKITEADIEADSLNQVLYFLSQKELKPISVEPIKVAKGGIFGLFDKITVTDKLFLAKYMSLMLKVGTDLISAVNILISDFNKPSMKNFLVEVRESLSRGRPFYEAFAKYPKTFSVVFVNLIKAAEESGNLQQTFEDLSFSLQREAELRSKIKSAFIYPIILSIMAAVIVIFLVTFALPKIADAFSQAGIKPPLFSRIVFGIGLFVGHNIIILGTIALILIGFCSYFFFKNSTGIRMRSRILENTPMIKNIYNDLAIQTFSSTFSSLMKAGLPIVRSINITAEVVGSEKFKVSLKRIGEEGLAKGLSVGEAFRREQVFPNVVSSLIAISEKAGHLDEILKTLAEFYATRVEESIRALVSLLEPLLLLIMGFLVAAIALSIIIPIYQLTTQF